MGLLNVKLSSRSQDGQEMWEGTAYLPGLKPSKIVNNSNDSTFFESRNAVATAARHRAKKLGFENADFEGSTAIKVAAKKSNKIKAEVPTDSFSAE